MKRHLFGITRLDQSLDNSPCGFTYSANAVQSTVARDGVLHTCIASWRRIALHDWILQHVVVKLGLGCYAVPFSAVHVLVQR